MESDQNGAPRLRPTIRTRRPNDLHVAPQAAGPAPPTVWVPASVTGVLTRFQVAIVRLVAEGYTDAKIGAELGLTKGTVSTEVARIRGRLDAANRAHLAAVAIRRGII